MRLSAKVKSMLTIEDLGKLRQIFATKQDLQEIKEELATKKQFNEVINKLDMVLKEVKDVRQEQQAHQGQHARVTDDMEGIKRALRKAGIAVTP